MALTTTGRKSGKPRTVIVAYLEDGQNLTGLAMNGWDEGHPAWWLNLEARPDALIRLPHEQPRPVRARCATGDERDRLWNRWLAIEPEDELFARSRSVETPVVVFEPQVEQLTPDPSPHPSG
jgi:deazaflavin-dependent oxidoreductase (nitroreductase family)